MDLLRALSAQAVCIGHAVSFFGIAAALPPHLPYFQNLAVIVFFVLSGLLIGSSLFAKSADGSYSFGHYVADRFARIYSGWVPGLVFVCAVDVALVAAHLHTQPEFVTLGAFVGNLVMLQGYAGPFDATLRVPSFGSAGPFWTLAIEWHIYMFVGALFFLLRGRSTWLAALFAACFAWLPLRYLFDDVQAGVGTALFSVWLIGFGFAAVRFPKVPAWIWLAALVLSLAGACWAVIPGREYSWSVYICVAAAVLSTAHLASRGQWIEGTALATGIRWMASYSLTLYLVHYTILYAMWTVWPQSGLVGAICGIALANGVAWPLSGSERRHKDLARWIKSHLSTRATNLAPT